MQLSIDTSAVTTADKASVVWLRRLLDLGLAGFAFSLGFRIAPVQIFLIVIIAATIGLQLSGVRVLRRTGLELPFALYVIALATGVLGSTAAGASLFAPDTWGVYRLASCILLVGAIGNAERGWRLAQIFVVAVAFQALYGFVQHFTGIDLFGAVDSMKRAPSAPDRYLAYGSYTRNSTMAFITTASLALISAALMAGAVRGRKRIVALLLTIPTDLGQLMTFVRTGWIALVGALATMTVVGRRGLKAALLLGALFGAIYLAVLATSAPMQKKSENAVAADFGSNWHRGFIWARSLEMISDHPVTGVGAGAFTGQTYEYYDAMSDKPPVRCHSHNNLLFVWTESGPLGLVAFVWLFTALLGALRNGIKRLDDDRRSAALVMGGAGVTVIFLVWTLFQDPLYDGMIAYAMAFCIALGLAAIPRAELEKAVDRADAPPAPRGSAAVAAIAITLAALGGLTGLDVATAAEGKVAALLLGLLVLGYVPLLPAPLARHLRALAALAGAIVLTARAFVAVVPPGTEAWWSTPSALASVAALVAGLAGAAWAMRRPGQVGAAAVAGALAAGWVVAWVGGMEYVLLPYLNLDINPDRLFSYNFALGGCSAGLILVAWAGPLGWGEGPVYGYAERLLRLPALAIALGLAAIAFAGLG